MGAVFFYHMTRTPLEQTLPALLGKSLDQGWRVLVRSTSADRLAWLDEKLWLVPEDGFLPHGIDGGPSDDRQPVLLSLGATGGRDALISVDGAEITADEAQSLQRASILFDGGDGRAVEHARGQWRTLTAAGCPAQYWSQETGRWTKKAEA